jgi:hypothetical protein
MSSINPNNIDGTYPIAGQDNDSQGFRDNFTNIKNNFTFAYDELTDLQNKAVLKSALNGSTLDNTVTYTSLNTSGNLLATGLSVFGNASISGFLNVSGNILAAGAVVNALTVNGTTTRAGATVDSSYQIYKPTANVSIQANVNVSRVIVAPISSIISFWTDVILPNVSTNGHTVSISSNVAIETFRVLSPWIGYTVDSGANVALAARTPATYIFHSAENKWFKV